MLSLNLNLTESNPLLPFRHVILRANRAGPTTTTHFPPKTTHISRPSLLLLPHRRRNPVAVSSAGDPPPAPEIPESPAMTQPKTLQLSIVFGFWYFQSIVFNICNTTALSLFPYPWFMASFQLLVGSILTAAHWALRRQPRPKLTRALLGALLAPALFHAVGQISAHVAFSKASLLTHVIKSSEPVFAAALGGGYTLATWLSLVPVTVGCSLAAAAATEAAFITHVIKLFGAVVVLRGRFPFPVWPTVFPIVHGWAVNEISVNWSGAGGALISIVGFVLRNIYSKKSLNSFQEVNGLDLYGCITLLSLVYLFPVAVFVEGSQWVKGYHSAVSVAPNPMAFYLWIMISGVLYHLYNQSSYRALDEISPLALSVGNTMKRVVVIALTVIVFRDPVVPLRAAGSAIAIFGTLLYMSATSKTCAGDGNKD